MEILAGLTDLDCSADALGYMDARSALVAAVPVLLLWIGFVGPRWRASCRSHPRERKVRIPFARSGQTRS